MTDGETMRYFMKDAKFQTNSCTSLPLLKCYLFGKKFNYYETDLLSYKKKQINFTSFIYKERPTWLGKQ